MDIIIMAVSGEFGSGLFLLKLCEEQVGSSHNENVVVVTHGGVINVIYHILRGLAWTNKSSKAFPASYTSIHKVEYCDGEWKISMENHIEHLNFAKN